MHPKALVMFNRENAPRAWEPKADELVLYRQPGHPYFHEYRFQKKQSDVRWWIFRSGEEPFLANAHRLYPASLRDGLKQVCTLCKQAIDLQEMERQAIEVLEYARKHMP
jgi:hypothetical protein